LEPGEAKSKRHLAVNAIQPWVLTNVHIEHALEKQVHLCTQGKQTGGGSYNWVANKFHLGIWFKVSAHGNSCWWWNVFEMVFLFITFIWTRKETLAMSWVVSSPDKMWHLQQYHMSKRKGYIWISTKQGANMPYTFHSVED
jgi:hypothetical protein